MAPLKRLALMARWHGCPDSARPLVLLRRCMSTSTWEEYWDASSPSKASEKKAPSRGKERLASVLDAIHERKLPPELRGRPNAVRSETDIVNVMEQRIWQSMEEGQFENLPGKGKPLNLNSNPHADPAEDTLFRILSKNGCAPEWVELNKEIRTKIAEWRTGLRKAWRSRLSETASEWQQETEVLKKQMRTINDMVFRYNLIVPFGRQMFGLSWEKELLRLEQ
ncbi:DnaJ-like protein subfamily C member 28 [Nymphaea thermarum]|nr:DnaJ-like protein subfamily C member 28 [Nymphaea thermarum]